MSKLTVEISDDGCDYCRFIHYDAGFSNAFCYFFKTKLKKDYEGLYTKCKECAKLSECQESIREIRDY